MRVILVAAFVAILSLLAVPASAHGNLEIHEFETLAISDFEGQEDSFPWEGFEIWDVYVGDGYDATQKSTGVYFKVNLAGDGKQRPLGGALWTLDFQFKVGDDSYERSITHTGAEVKTTFESLEWLVADGNVFQVKAWAPVLNWTGKSVSDIVILSSVDGDPRDVAPGGIFDPATGTEMQVKAPATPIFPPLGEGRLVESVPMTGPEKFVTVEVTPKGDGVFDLLVTNPLKAQGQHVLLREPVSATWGFTASTMGASLDAAASTTLTLAFKTTATSGLVEPLVLELYTDIGGLHVFYAYLDNGEVHLVRDASQATTATLETAKESPNVGLVALLAVLGTALLARRRNQR